MNDSSTPTSTDHPFLADMARRLAETFPDIRQQARELASEILLKHTGNKGELDRIWWHRWDNAHGSPRTFTGWLGGSIPAG